MCIFMIKSTMDGAGNPASLTSVMTKIFMSYLQLVGLAARFDLSWPAEVCFLITSDIFSYNRFCFLSYNLFCSLLVLPSLLFSSLLL